MPLLLHEKKWINNIRFQKGRLLNKASSIIPKTITTSKQYLSYANKSRFDFDEPFSDSCLVSAMQPIFENETCHLPSKCDIMIDDTQISPSYNISHRLLILLTAKVFECKWNSEMVERKIEKFCDFMLWEANAMYPLQLTDHGYADLFLEQSKN